MHFAETGEVSFVEVRGGALQVNVFVWRRMQSHKPAKVKSSMHKHFPTLGALEQ